MLDTIPVALPLHERIMVRFGATLLANLLRAGVSFASGILIARGLGASGYGDLNFLLGSVAAVSLVLEMGTSSAFYTFISQRRRSRAFLSLYVAWIIFQFLATVLVVGLLLPNSLVERIWVGHGRGVVLLAFAASFLTAQTWGMVSQLGEALRKTVTIQAVATAQALAHLALIAAAVYWGWLSVSLVMWLLVGEYVLLAVVLGPRLTRESLAPQADSGENFKTIVSEFAGYCKPLVVYGWVGVLYAFADRWLLQQFGGAEQQGFFAIGQQFANISLIATTSILRVFWKEIAEARERQNHERIRELYHTISRGLYFTGAWISCSLIPYSREILSWTAGGGYAAATVCLALMFLFPVHQALGQIQGTFFYASGDTKTFSRIGFIMMGISIPVTYFVLASDSSVVAGLGLGAVGLAVKMVALQIVGVNLQAYVIARSHGWSYDVGYQGTVLGLFVSLGWACKWTSSWISGANISTNNPAVVMLLGTSLYVCASWAVFACFPSVVGLTWQRIKYGAAWGQVASHP